jgi:hypothetical protein
LLQGAGALAMFSLPMTTLLTGSRGLPWLDPSESPTVSCVSTFRKGY